MKVKARARGFTLLELVVVMAIIVALAGIAVAKFDVLQLKSEKAAAASTMTTLARTIQTFRATTNVYPDGWDSLLDGGALVGSDFTSPGLDPGIAGTGGFEPKLVAGTLTAGEIQSLGRLGIKTVYDATGTGAYKDRFRSVRVLSTTVGAGTGPAAAFINPGSTTTAPANGQKIINAIYPSAAGDSAVPANKRLVVFGLGKYATIIGGTKELSMLAEAPGYTYSNPVYYDRYLAVFEVDNTGKRCRLMTVLGADGDLAADEIADFNANN